MTDQEVKELIGKKVDRYKDKLLIKDLQLNVLLETTNAINNNLSTLEILDKFQYFVKEQLHIDRMALFAKYRKWRCLLEYGLPDSEIDEMEVERDMMWTTDINSVDKEEHNALRSFDMIVPVYHGEKPLAYLLLGDSDEESIAVSSIIKHLNFLQLLTNIIVSSIENRRLADEALKQEKEKQRLIEKQKEILEVQVAERTKELRFEKEESEKLLHNILPKVVADELMENGKTAAQEFEEVSIIFTDFKDFTVTASKISAHTLVEELNDIFKAFDHIVEKYGIEKIKTIGDAYMAVCGVPKSSTMHAIQSVNAASEMLSFLEKRGKTAKIKWKMRVGIHSGPLMAGVVGARKFTYDVWGDTVNTASRMESSGEPGKINVSASTHKLIKDEFHCHYRGKVMAKGKGKVDMYFIEGPNTDTNFAKVKEFILDKLKKKLSKKLYYHGFHHTMDVYDAVIRIANKENVKGKNMELLKIAALFHDSGFTNVYDGHEEEGCKLVKEILPDFNYSKKQIDIICGIIIATKIPQSPKTHLEEIICDADLDYLGRDDFVPIADSLFRELNANGKELTDKQWNKIQLKFLGAHSYFTEVSKMSRQTPKQYNLEKIQDLVNSEKQTTGI